MPIKLENILNNEYKSLSLSKFERAEKKSSKISSMIIDNVFYMEKDCDIYLS